jgi:hypothetical protein
MHYNTLLLELPKVNGDEMHRYDAQMRLILENIFEPKEKNAKKSADNWICKMTNIVGGTHYQHPHSDQAWPLEHEGERTFPFVVTHGFGVNPFEMWILTKSNKGKGEYGTLHKFPPTAMLFMRGDFVHAGGAMWYPRCHMKFYPRIGAGLVKNRTDNYWLLPHFKPDISADSTLTNDEHVFLWQHYTFPFAYPLSERTYNAKDACVDEIVTYPPELTNHMLLKADIHIE